jgi:hypothetical protein
MVLGASAGVYAHMQASYVGWLGTCLVLGASAGVYNRMHACHIGSQ